MSSTVLAQHIRRAAHGKHVCQLCRRRINESERYVDTRIADDGTAYTWREHTACSRFMSDHFEGDDGYDYVTFCELVADNVAKASECGIDVEWMGFA